MMTKDTKIIINNARDVLVGKIPNPQSQIEQITVAMIYKFMNDMDKEAVKYGVSKSFFKGDLSQYSWDKLMSVQLGNEARINLYIEALEKIQLAKQIPDLFRQIFKNAYLPFKDGQTLSLFLKEIDKISYDNSENLGNAFEYLLSILGSQGDAGQFRTPRNIIDFMVEVISPLKTDAVLDPACGTAGFLISAYKYILRQNTKKNPGDKLTPKEKQTLTDNILGYDISPDMAKLGLVNLYLHGFKKPKIFEYDTLTSDTRWDDKYDIILANPPFMTPKGGIKPHNRFAIKANRSEVLFVDYIMEHLTINGKAAIIVPEGIIFQSGNSYKDLRKKLIEENYLYAVVSLPSGVFNPYAGVKTSILFMDKQLAKNKKEILFIKIQNDGFDLGANRRQIDKNDLPTALEILNKWNSGKKTENKLALYVEKSKIAEDGDYNLSADRYSLTIDYSNCKWDMVKLGDVCEIVRGGSPRPIDKYITTEETGLNWLRIGDIEEGAKYIYKTSSKIRKEGLSKTRLLKQGDFILSNSMSFGRPYIMQVEACIHDGWVALQNISKLLNKEYLYFILSSDAIKNQFLKFATGSTVKNLKIDTIKITQIPLPPLEIQEQIVAELNDYKNIITGAKQIAENWKPKIEIDPTWKKVKLGEVCNIFSGGTPSRTEKKYWGGNVPWLSARYFSDDHKINGSEMITKDGLKNSSSKIVPKGSTILITRVSVGKFAIADKDYAINQDLTALVPTENTLDYKYLWFISAIVAEKIKSNAVGIGVTGVTRSFIVNQEIPLPSLKVQKEIVEKIEAEHTLVESAKKLIKIYEQKTKDVIAKLWTK